MSGVSFVSTALMGTNKVGDLKPDAQGYYTVVLGGFETENAHGHYYSFEQQTKELFEQSSQFMRQIQQGNLWGEFSHPKREVGESISSFLRRCIIVDENKWSHHIRAVSLNNRDVKDKKGRAIVAVIGEIKPMGPYGQCLKEILDTRHANACFSVRAQTDDKIMPNGKECRSTKNIITYDYVGDPGVQTSTKYHSPKLESFYDQYVDLSVLESLRREVTRHVDLKMESASVIVTLDQIINDNRANIFGGSRQAPRSRSW